MKRRTPALRKAILRYNDLCRDLQDLLDATGKQYPTPQPIPTELTRLKDDVYGITDSILEDVWLTGQPQQPLPWLTDPIVRSGIRAMHLLDRCDEELLRLEVERPRLSEWLQRRRADIVAARADEDCKPAVMSPPH